MMLALLLLAAGLEPALQDVARVAAVMVDGEECKRIVKKEAIREMFQPDPRDKWSASDNYNVHAEPYIRVKKTLLRLAKLANLPCDVNLWMPLPRDKVHVVIRNTNEMSQFWPWGVLFQDTPEPMKKVFATGEHVVVKQRPGMVSVLAPVRDSLGDIVALVEVVGVEKANRHENVK